MSQEQLFEKIYNSRLKRAGKTREQDEAEGRGEKLPPVDEGDEPHVTAPPSEPHVTAPPSEPQANEEDYESMRNQINKLQNDLRSMEGRLVPSQQRNAGLEKALQAMQEKHAKEMEEMQLRLSEYEKQEYAKQQQATTEDVLSVLTDDEKDMFDPAQLQAFAKMTAEMSTRLSRANNIEDTVASVLRKKEYERVDAYRNEILADETKETHKILQMADDPNFKEWAQQNYDVRTSLNNFLNARTIKEIDESAKHIVKRIKNYQDEVKRGDGSTDVTTSSLSSAMSRGSNTQGKSKAELNKKYELLKQLSRSRNPNDQSKAKALLSELNQIK